MQGHWRKLGRRMNAATREPEDLPMETLLARDGAIGGQVVRFLVCALALVCAWPAEAAPRRIVSLDYCADQFVLALADRDQIAALSRGSRRDDSYFRARAGGLRQTRGTLEEVLALRPDLVVRSWGGPWDAERVYAQFSVAVLQVGGAQDFAGARGEVVRAAAALGHPGRGAVIARDLDERLARLAALPAPRAPDAMYLSAGGASAGRGTMMDAVITAAGGRNVRTEESWAVLPLERLAEAPPALIALGFFDHGRTAMNAWLPGRHPAVRRALDAARTVSLPPDAVSCEAWFAIDAAEAIAAALRTP
jgi:iron complex transport system substrate-binding protein